MPPRARSAQRKQNLIRAAEAAIAELSLSRLTIRDIAAHAAVSPGSVLYHYPETKDLVYDLHQDLVDRYVEQRMAAVADVKGPPHRILGAFRSGLPAGPDDQVCRVLYELHGLALRSKQHASLMTSLWDREVMLFESLITAGMDTGDFSPQLSTREIATSLLAMEDGLGLHLVSGNARVTHAGALRVLAAHAGAVLHYDFLPLL
ncbi:TetR family transcriptional regulator C-terminal domain-containing protein [Actinoplanes sp. NPDC048791]|uniref:TetR/AcrR family transcriptional regulator n=1 Tax=Actinoplanes sp. NPDC048791 TaxID=3154623 RepID=UPI003405BB2A